MSSNSSQRLLGYLADDFTGATDALEVLATHGVRAALFARPPDAAMLARYPDLRAVGLACAGRAMAPPRMNAAIPPLLRALRDCAPALVHYKACSTFDSSPSVGSIGRVIDLAAGVFDSSLVPVVAGAPSLGRHCVFGHSFVRNSSDPHPLRLDRHPSISRHPVTPMDEADLRVHLSKQTARRIGLLDVLVLDRGFDAARDALERLRQEGHDVVVIDLLQDRQLSAVGALLARFADKDKSGFVVGSSGVESALCEHWVASGQVGEPHDFPTPIDVGPILVVVGSRSSVSATQRRFALEHGFVPVTLRTSQCVSQRATDQETARVSQEADAAIRSGRSVVIDSGPDSPMDRAAIAAAMAQATRRVVERSSPRRLLVAGGDTSSAVAEHLRIDSLEMVARLVRGAPVCHIAAPGEACDGLEVIFKGGQVGAAELFVAARS